MQLNPRLRRTDLGTIHGCGLVATEPIAAGEFIWRATPDQVYSVEQINAWTREAQLALFSRGYQISDHEIADEDNDSRCTNHSCDPNLWYGDDTTLVARRDIAPGEEVTYDYSAGEYLIEFEMECRCGSPRCRGVITNRDYLLPALQEAYGKHMPGYMLRAIERARKPTL